MKDEINIDGDKIDIKELMIDGSYINEVYADTFILNESDGTDETPIENGSDSG